MEEVGVAEELQKKTRRIKLEANDATVFEIDEDVAYKSKRIQGMMQAMDISDLHEHLAEPFPVACADGKTLKKILEYCTAKRREVYKPREPWEDPRIQLSEWDVEYVDISAEELVEVMEVAHYLDIPGIVDISTQKIANMAEGMTSEELRVMFRLNDLTPEEEEDMRERFAWAELL